MTVETPDPEQLDLDRLDLGRLDPGGMLSIVERSPQQWGEALEAANEVLAPGFPDPAGGQELRLAVVAGMGGSGIAADVAVAAAGARGRVPVLAAKGYDLPAVVGPGTLVVVVSHSGDTEETRSCFDAAVASGAAVCAVASGGQIAAEAARLGLPCVRIRGDLPPRASLPSLVVAALAVLDRAGALDASLSDLAGVPAPLGDLVRRWEHGVPERENPVKAMARRLSDLVPVFYGGRGWPALTALRGKCQVNENAKRPAFWGELPEIDHNEVVGWDRLASTCARLGLVCLRSDADEHPQVVRRFAATVDLVGPRFGAVVEHRLQGPTPLARFAAGALFVDLLSVYLGFLQGADPTPVATIDELKRRVAPRRTHA